MGCLGRNGGFIRTAFVMGGQSAVVDRAKQDLEVICSQKSCPFKNTCSFRLWTFLGLALLKHDGMASMVNHGWNWLFIRNWVIVICPNWELPKSISMISSVITVYSAFSCPMSFVGSVSPAGMASQKYSDALRNLLGKKTSNAVSKQMEQRVTKQQQQRLRGRMNGYDKK